MAETVEAWCAQLVETDDLARKLTPAPPPPLGAECSWEPAPRPRRIPAPGRPARLEVCALLSKPSRREVEIRARWIGFEIPDEFVVGYGIDYAQRNRNLPYIGAVVFD